MGKMIALLISALIYCVPIISQKTDIQYLNHNYTKDFNLVSGNDSILPFFISQKPITNREYIIYLGWLEKVYSSYPEQLAMAFPFKDSLIIKSDEPITLKLLAESSGTWIGNYMFNPKYIDYPVLGVKYHQIADFCSWLTDRYNEYLLIKNKYIQPDPYQMDDNCFVTETFLAEQYEGNRNLDFDPEKNKTCFMDYMLHKCFFINAFRLPSKCEIEKASKDQLYESQIKPYKSYEFLKIWDNVKIKNNLLIVSISEEGPLEPLSITNVQAIKLLASYNEYFIDDAIDTKECNVLEIYNNLKYSISDKKQMLESEKDSLGRMQYIIVAEDDNNQPVILKKSTVKTTYFSNIPLNIFRVAFCPVRVKPNK